MLNQQKIDFLVSITDRKIKKLAHDIKRFFDGFVSIPYRKIKKGRMRRYSMVLLIPTFGKEREPRRERL
jgi:hypothetical protein